mgnify:FL=1
MAKIKPNAYNGWDPLKQVILGSAYTPDFFEDIKDSKLRDLLQKLLYETQEDLNGFKRMLNQAGVDVLQYPENTSVLDLNKKYESVNEIYDEQADKNWNYWLTQRGGIPKPAIAPRDQLITYGNKLSMTGHDPAGRDFFLENDWIDKENFDTRLVDEHDFMTLGPLEPTKYNFDGRNMKWDNRFIEGTNEYAQYRNMSWGYQAPSVTRVGDTLVVDEIEVSNLGEYLRKEYPQFKQTHHAMGGHNDGVFCPVKPGAIITTDERTNYSDTFPGWDVHVINNPYQVKDVGNWNKQRIGVGGEWWTPERESNPEYVKFIDSWLTDWVGAVNETQFEVNMLVINPNLVFCTNYNEGVWKFLKSIGVEPVIMPFRHRFFWDAGLHCLTLDTVREGGMQNYFK